MTLVSGIRYGSHIGPCREAGIAAGELAICVSPGTPLRHAVHVVGSTFESIVAARLRGVDTSHIESAMAGLSIINRAPHCECHTRELARVRDRVRGVVRASILAGSSIPTDVTPSDGGYDCYLAALRHGGVALSRSSNAMADEFVGGGS